MAGLLYGEMSDGITSLVPRQVEISGYLQQKRPEDRFYYSEWRAALSASRGGRAPSSVLSAAAIAAKIDKWVNG